MIIGIEKVREFMRTFDQECPSTPTLPPHTTVKNRAYYQFSETQEMEDAEDIVEYFDAVLDQLYIAYGHAVAAGISGRQILEGFLEVHSSNMTKLWPANYIHNAPPGSVMKEVTPGLYSVKDSYGKVVKPPTYIPPDLAPIIKKT